MKRYKLKGDLNVLFMVLHHGPRLVDGVDHPHPLRLGPLPTQTDIVDLKINNVAIHKSIKIAPKKGKKV